MYISWLELIDCNKVTTHVFDLDWFVIHVFKKNSGVA